MVQAQPPGGNSPLASMIKGALDWWQEAGVDLDFVDAPVAWQAMPEPGAAGSGSGTAQSQVEPSPAPPPAIAVGGDPAAYPATLAEFQAWWLQEPSLDDGQVRDRVPPRGPARASLMVIVAQPEAEDGAELLSGREGQLLRAFLSAAALDPDQVYLASALPRRMALPDWAGLSERGLGKVLEHHVRLVAPARVLVFGTNILPLLGHDTAQNSPVLPAFKQEGGKPPVLAARELGALLARPAWKAGLWRNWLDWTGTTSA